MRVVQFSLSCPVLGPPVGGDVARGGVRTGGRPQSLRRLELSGGGAVLSTPLSNYLTRGGVGPREEGWRVDHRGSEGVRKGDRRNFLAVRRARAGVGPSRSFSGGFGSRIGGSPPIFKNSRRLARSEGRDVFLIFVRNSSQLVLLVFENVGSVRLFTGVSQESAGFLGFRVGKVNRLRSTCPGRGRTFRFFVLR